MGANDLFRKLMPNEQILKRKTQKSANLDFRCIFYNRSFNPLTMNYNEYML